MLVENASRFVPLNDRESMQTSTHLELAVTSNPETNESLDGSIARITRKARRKLRTEEVKREACRPRDVREREKEEK